MRLILCFFVVVFACQYSFGQDFDTKSILVIQTQSQLEKRSNELNVWLKSQGVSSSRVLNRNSRKSRSKNSRQNLLITFESDQDILQKIKDFEATGLFLTVEPNFIGQGESTIPNDPIFTSKQYYHVNNGSFDEVSGHPAQVNADMDTDLAWDITTGNDKVVLGVFDSGLKMDHDEFTGRHWFNTEEIPNNNIDDDGNGYIDDINGWDFVNNDNDPTDDHAHGTNVTGIAAATGNNGFGMAGMDWNCKIMTLKVLDSENAGKYSHWIESLYYAADNGIHVGNMSLSGSSFSQSFKDAIDYAYNAGVLVVVAMGNNDSNTIRYPAGFEHSMAIGATNPDDKRVTKATSSWGSNYGAHIDCVAPGNRVYSARYNNGSSFTWWMGGTSQATPQVAGLACLIKGLDLSRGPDEIRGIINSTAIDQVGAASEDQQGFDHYYGHGRINAYQALLASSPQHDYDIALNDIDLGAAVCGLETAVSIDVTNQGKLDVTSVELRLTENGDLVVQKIVPVDIVSGASGFVDLGVFELTPGERTLSVEVVLVNGTVDEDASDDLVVHTVEMVDGDEYEFYVELNSLNQAINFSFTHNTILNTVESVGLPYAETATERIYDLCLADGCYDFSITDPFGGGCTTAAWVSSQNYCVNDQVSYSGKLYRAKWCGAGETPISSGEWGQWEELGECSSSTGTDVLGLRSVSESLFEITVAEFQAPYDEVHCLGTLTDVESEVAGVHKFIPTVVSRFETINVETEDYIILLNSQGMVQRRYHDGQLYFDGLPSGLYFWSNGKTTHRIMIL